jgi:putative DNA primase/helicase
MRAAEIAAALGGAHRSGAWWRCRCPAHASRGPTLALRNGERGLIIKCWAGCDRRDVLAELRRCGLIDNNSGDEMPRLSRPTIRSAEDEADAARRLAMARRIWNAAQDARETPVVRYLAGRGITIPAPLTLRWAPSLRRPDRTAGPAMVARVDSLDGILIAVHRTWIDCDAAAEMWRRRDRASLGPVRGGAVRLAPAAETLLIGEGIETTLAGMVATGLPGWAALSTSGLKALALPAEVRSVVICADNDDNGAGERAARTAEQRWRAEGRGVQIYISPYVGEDAADRLLAVSEARHAA